MDKAKIVSDLIANGVCAEAERVSLMGLSEKALGLMVANTVTPPVAPAPVVPPVAPVAPATVVNTAAPVVPVATPAPTAEAYISNAPPEIRGMLEHSLGTYKAQRGAVVARIVANKANTLTAEQLAALPDAVLNQMDQLSTVATPAAPAPYFIGAAGGAPSTNAKTPEPLAVPVMNFGK